MSARNKYQKIINADNWYIQGFAGTPLFLNTSAISGTLIKKQLGFSYDRFIINYHPGQEGECCYGQSDLKKIWRMVYRHFQEDRQYLEGIKQLYLNNLKVYEPVFRELSPAFIKALGDKQLLDLLKILAEAQMDSVGVSHIIEAISIRGSEEFKTELTKNLPQLTAIEIDRLAVELTAPDEKSFLSQEEEELRRIMKMKNYKSLLLEHQRRYGWWLNNGYAGPKSVSAAEFKSKGEEILASRPIKSFPSQLGRLTKKYRLNKTVRDLVYILVYTTVWQDERKVLIMQAIGRLGTAVKEISRRLNWPPDLMYHLGYSEVMALRSIKSLTIKKATLQIRKREGSIWLFKNGRDITIIDHYARDFGSDFSMIKLQAGSTQEEIHGQVASPGTASGRVSILNNLASLKKVRPNDVIVTSMTRPDYVVALKKAVAIITDEGGITCHAAIISRELGIPAVIGTKIATKVLRDGDLVEVRANHGVVKIIKGYEEK